MAIRQQCLRATSTFLLLVASCAPAEVETSPAPEPPAASAAVPTTPSPPMASTTIWDGVFTPAQANRGSDVANRVCFACHAETEWTRPGFLGGRNGQSIHALWALIHETMPEDSPGSLSDQQYADVVAYMLELNGAPAGETELPSEESGLLAIRVVPREGL